MMIIQGALLRKNLNWAFIPLLGSGSTFGTHLLIMKRVMIPKPMDMMKGMRHDMEWLRKVPNGTPMRLAKGIPKHIMETALVPLPFLAIFTATIVPVPK